MAQETPRQLFIFSLPFLPTRLALTPGTRHKTPGACRRRRSRERVTCPRPKRRRRVTRGSRTSQPSTWTDDRQNGRRDDHEATKRRGVLVRDVRTSPAHARVTATRGGDAMTSRQAQVASLSAHLQVRPRNARAFSSCSATRGVMDRNALRLLTAANKRAAPCENRKKRILQNFQSRNTLTRRPLFLSRQAKLTLLASRSRSPTSPRRRSHSGSPRECGSGTPGSPSDGRGHGSPPGASRRRNNPAGRALRRTRSGSVLSPTSSPPARAPLRASRVSPTTPRPRRA